MTAMDRLLSADAAPTPDEVLSALTLFLNELSVKFAKDDPVSFMPQHGAAMRMLLIGMTITAHGDDDLADFLTAYRGATRIAARGHSYSANDADRLEQHTDSMVVASKKIRDGFRYLIDQIGGEA